MLPYWTLFAIYAAGALQSRARLDRISRPGILLLLALPLILMIGLRYEVGGDWENYLNIFEATRYQSFFKTLRYGDPGYMFVNGVTMALGFDIWLVNLVCAVIFVTGIHLLARRQPDPWLAYLVAIPYLIIVVGMGYTRQAAALGFVMMALAQRESRNSLILFLVYFMLGASFHKSAVVVLPIIGLARYNRNLLHSIGFVGLSIAGYFLFLDSSVDALLQNYVAAEYKSDGAVIRVAMNVVPAVIYLAFRNRFGFSQIESRLWLFFSLVALLCAAMLVISPSSTAVDRVALYLIPLQMAVLPRVPLAFGEKGVSDAPLRILVIVYLASTLFVWLNFATHAQAWLPYRFYPLVPYTG